MEKKTNNIETSSCDSTIDRIKKIEIKNTRVSSFKQRYRPYTKMKRVTFSKTIAQDNDTIKTKKNNKD
jgi:hypothetical protein